MTTEARNILTAYKPMARLRISFHRRGSGTLLNSQEDHFDTQGTKVIDLTINGIAIVLVPVAGLICVFAAVAGWSLVQPIQFAAFAIIWFVALKKALLKPLQRAVLVAGLFLIAALGDVYSHGLHTVLFPVLAVLPILGAGIGGYRLGSLGILVTVLAVLTVGLLPPVFGFPPSAVVQSELHFSYEWIAEIGSFLIASILGVLVVGALHQAQKSHSEMLQDQNADLLRSQTRVKQLTKLANLGYSIANIKTGAFIECDEIYSAMHGLTKEEALGREFSTKMVKTVIHDDDLEAALETLRHLHAGESMICELRHILPDGEIRTLRKIMSPLNPLTPKDGLVEVVSQDITESRQLQDQLFQVQKMEAIGNLTGGVAHDFNNLLAVILGNLELLAEETEEPDKIMLIRAALDSTLRGAELTRNMLSFARRAPLTPKITDLNELVRNLESWISRTLPTTIEVETDYTDDLWLINVDPSSAESGLLNLIVNARDAMPDGGKLKISTTNVAIDENSIEAQSDNEIEPGNYVKLSVSDTGSGIPQSNIKRIFDPFFTTKPVGGGSGLGLSMIDGFVKQSGGTIRVHSQPGEGSRFDLYFKMVEAKPELEQEDSADSGPIKLEEKATILLVEDNLDVLKTVRAGLTRDGYRVIESTSGDDAKHAFVEHPEIDLLLTDIVMPGELQGVELAQTLRKLRPDLPVVFMSGYASDATVYSNARFADDIRLMKPVQREDLLAALSKALL